MKYQNFSVEDFVMDDFFMKWVKDPDTETEQFWQNWLALHPEKESNVKAARQLIEDLQFKSENLPSYEDHSGVWKRLQKSSVEWESPAGYTAPVKVRRSWYPLAAAVIALLLVFGAVFLLTYNQGQNEFETAYSQIESLKLPDGSMVTLGANSKINYYSDWDTQPVREIWLSGEAFFSVQHLENEKKFIVHTKDLDVEVVGTEFNVNDRRGEVQVILENGRVNLNIPQQGDTAKILMKPGELVQYSPVTRETLQKTLQDTKKYTSWKDNLLVFKGTPVAEIARIIEDYHGLRVVFKNPEIKKRAFTAEIPAKDPTFLLNLLSESLEIKITRNDNTVLIENK